MMRKCTSAALLLTALAAALALPAAGCRSPGKRISFAQPAPPHPVEAHAAKHRDAYRDADCSFEFDARTRGIRVVVKNLSAGSDLVVDWAGARYIDAAGRRHEVVGYDAPRAAVLRESPPAPLVLAPGARWEGKIHPRERCEYGTGTRFYEHAILDEEREPPGTLVGLELPIETGGVARGLKFTFAVAAEDELQ